MNTNTKTKLRILALTIMVLGLVTSQLFSATPTITNITASQRPDTKLIDITYDLVDEDGDRCTVEIKMSADSGETYRVPIKTVSGHIGEDVQPGTERKIVWDAGADWDGEFSDTMKVKLEAVDWKGIPGLEFGDEVKLGGFQMGNTDTIDTKRVNIGYSYWLSKFEITVDQYTKFLNLRQARNRIRIQNDAVLNNNGKLLIRLSRNDTGIWYTGGKFLNYNFYRGTKNWTEEQISNANNYPVVVTYRGAVEFAAAYGYDVPTEAEWEKAARGPDHDDLGEHSLFPWNTIHWGTSANWDLGWFSDIGRVDSQVPGVNKNKRDTKNGYGLYHILGNVPEWTRSWNRKISYYPDKETLNGDTRSNEDEGVTVRGGWPDSSNRVYFKEWMNMRKKSLEHEENGFRVIRRNLPN